MASDYDSVQLGEVATVRSGYAFKSSDWTDSGVPVVKISNVKDGRLVMDSCSYVTPEIAATAAEFALEAGDILIAMTGYIGDVALVRPSDLPVILNQRVGRFSVRDNSRLDRRFLFYLLRSPDIRTEIEGLGYGSAQPNVSPSLIHGVEIPLPLLHKQRAIAHILGTLDDKIDLHRRMNETLEATARALFRSWFVDFDPVRAKVEGRDPGVPQSLADLFSTRLVKSELGEIPEGWTVEKIGNHMLNFDSQRIPVSGAERAKRQGPYPYHGAAGVMDHVDDYLFDGIYLLVGEDGSVVRDTGLAVTQYVWGKIWVNNHAHVLQGKGPVSTEQLLLYFHFEPVAAYVTGAVQPKLSQGRMNLMPFVFAGERICWAFANLVRPWFARLRANTDAIQTLATIRNALLPKLVSGELRVKDAEKFIGRPV